MTRRPKTKRQLAVRHRSPTRSRWVVVAVAVAALVGVIWALVSPRASGVGIVQSKPLTVQSLRVDVIREIPHDTTAYTQGLLWRDGWLYESTGQYGESRLNRIDPHTGVVVQQLYGSPTFFGEGLAVVDNQLVMLTWRAEQALVYDIDSFEEIRSFSYEGEGWGLCHDGRRLVMTNGSDTLTFRDPMTFEKVGSVRVTLRRRPQTQLNELACVGNIVYANVYQEDYLVAIDPDSGRVTHQIDASGLLTPDEAHGSDVLNGIAYDPNSETFYITGKDWPKMFEVRFVE